MKIVNPFHVDRFINFLPKIRINFEREERQVENRIYHILSDENRGWGKIFQKVYKSGIFQISTHYDFKSMSHLLLLIWIES